MRKEVHFAARFLVVSACLWHTVFCTILRLPCTTHAEFNVFEFGKLLKGNVISRHYSTNDIQCTVFCVQNQKCRSYNINEAKLICELNSKALADNGTQLTDDAEWLYKSTDYNNLFVGPVCKDLRPCENGILCRDKCTAPYFECVYCDDKHTGLHCDVEKEINECQVNPCKNGGECVDERFGYKCICKAGFNGKYCQNDINECDSLPCFNGGFCQNKLGHYNCACAPGFFGIHCENINECHSNPCQNGGTCTDLANRYSCQCIAGFTGVNCETNINECHSNPCQNGGTCTDLANRYSCQCIAGFTGVNCETNINECHSNPCQHGGTCTDLANRYSCQCVHGYIGVNCERYDGCNSNPCLFYERCVNGIYTYSCIELTNVALYKLTHQSSTHGTSVFMASSERAVDGNRASKYNSHSCTHTIYGGDPQPWWEVYLGKKYSITGVEITNRGDCCGERLRSFDVTVDAKLCFHRSQQVLQGASIKLPCSSVLNGQRLKIQLKNSEALSLCEVKVYTPDEDVNECLSNPCKNGGTCTDFNNYYSCQCTAGFKGINCQT